MSENTAVESSVVEAIANEGVDANALAHQINNFKNGTAAVYSSIQGDDFDSKLQVAAALSSAGKIDDNIDKVIDLANFVIQGIEIADENTGELLAVPRVILIDKDGNAFAGISRPLMSSLETLVNVLGQPHTWEKPVPVKVTIVKTRKGFKAFNLAPVTTVTKK